MEGSGLLLIVGGGLDAIELIVGIGFGPALAVIKLAKPITALSIAACSASCPMRSCSMACAAPTEVCVPCWLVRPTSSAMDVR